MHMAVKTQDMREPGQLAQEGIAVHGPLPPGPEDVFQGRVGEDHQGFLGVQAGEGDGQPAVLVLPQGEGRAPGGGLPGCLQAEKMHALKGIEKGTFAEHPPPIPRDCRTAVPFAGHRQEGGREVGKNLPSQSQRVRAPVVGQVPGKEHHIRRRREGPNFRHRPGQGPGLGALVVSVPQMGIGQEGQPDFRATRLRRERPDDPPGGQACSQG